ncbi:MAG: hypothetical protein RIR00_2316 [Pseudomonadota bacterium]
MSTFRRFWDSASSACTYLLYDRQGGTGVCIDPVREHLPLYLRVLQELRLQLAAIVETHVHADHFSAASELRASTGALLLAGRHSGTVGADRLVDEGDQFNLGGLNLQLLATPGHAPGSLSLRCGDRLFTGDSLLIGSWGRTDEPGSNPGQLFDSISRLLRLPDECSVLPGHGSQGRWISCLGEERRSNPMFQGLSRDEFIARCSQQRLPPLPEPAACLAHNRDFRVAA